MAPVNLIDIDLIDNSGPVGQDIPLQPAHPVERLRNVVRDGFSMTGQRLRELPGQLRDPIGLVNRSVQQMNVVPDSQRDEYLDSIAALPKVLREASVAVVALSHVDYRTGERLDMAQVTELAHRHGATVLWDLSHSAGAVGVDLAGCDVDFAVASGYKYLCGGPGASALLYVHPRWQSAAWPAICGWMGHADAFALDPDYAPAAGIDRQLAGTPAVIANAAWRAAAEIWRRVDRDAMDARHRSLGETFIRLVDEQCAGLGVAIASPRAHALRGGHVTLRMAAPDRDVSALARALTAAKVMVSPREPDALRFGIHPLATRHADLWTAVQRLRRILEQDHPPVGGGDATPA